MKLRVKGNSLRLRLTRPEVVRLLEDGFVEESADFGAGATLIYRLQSAGTQGLVRAEFHHGTILVIIPTEAAQAWAASDEAGVYAQAGALQISIEKDFRCLTRSGEEEEADAFPHPAEPPLTDPGGTTCRS